MGLTTLIGGSTLYKITKLYNFSEIGSRVKKKFSEREIRCGLEGICLHFKQSSYGRLYRKVKFVLILKINSKWINNLNIIAKTYETFRREQS